MRATSSERRMRRGVAEQDDRGVADADRGGAVDVGRGSGGCRRSDSGRAGRRGAVP